MSISLEFIPWIFAAMLLVGVAYLVISLLAGGIFGDADFDFDGSAGDLLAGADSPEIQARGIGCSTIAAFIAGFGAMGLFGSLAKWNLLVTIIVALLFGIVLGRIVIAILRWVSRQESTDIIQQSNLIGSTVRVTVDTPAGKFGEGMIEEPERIKYPIKNLANRILYKGDFVEVIDVVRGRLFVKRKNEELYTEEEIR